MAYDILIVDDEQDICTGVAGILEDEGYAPRTATTSAMALNEVKKRQPALVILDVWLQGSDMDGLQILTHLKRHHPDMPVVMISGHGTMEMAVSATKMGAYDFISKPFNSDVLLHTIDRAIDDSRLRYENKVLQEIAGIDVLYEISGTSSAITAVRELVDDTAQTDARVFISGESGAGQTLLARIIHSQSSRANNPFVVLPCSRLTEEDLESQLFGVESVGDAPRQVGVLEQAHGGTLVLDEVTDMSPELQRKMVRILHSTKFQRLGGDTMVEVNVRVMSTTAKDIQALIEAKEFSADLYSRLNLVHIPMPSLSERAEDIPTLAEHMLDLLVRRRGYAPKTISPTAMMALRNHTWDGNLWELDNTVERLLMHAKTSEIGADDVNAVLSGQSDGGAVDTGVDNGNLDACMAHPLKQARELFEIDYFTFQLKRFDGNISRTAEFVGMDRAALHRKLKGLAIGTKEGTKQSAS